MGWTLVQLILSFFRWYHSFSCGVRSAASTILRFLPGECCVDALATHLLDRDEVLRQLKFHLHQAQHEWLKLLTTILGRFLRKGIKYSWNFPLTDSFLSQTESTPNFQTAIMVPFSHLKTHWWSCISTVITRSEPYSFGYPCVSVKKISGQSLGWSFTAARTGGCYWASLWARSTTILPYN